MDSNIATQTQRGDKASIPINPKKRITPIPENSHGYQPFDMRSICGFTNNQVIYYLITGQIRSDCSGRVRPMANRNYGGNGGCALIVAAQAAAQLN